jgi:hypothetical protein
VRVGKQSESKGDELIKVFPYHSLRNYAKANSGIERDGKGKGIVGGEKICEGEGSFVD